MTDGVVEKVVVAAPWPAGRRARVPGRRWILAALLLVAGGAGTAPVVTGALEGRRVATAVHDVSPDNLSIAVLALLGAVSLAGWWRAAQQPSVEPTIEAVRSELVKLREENARLRLEQQRALSLGRAAERIQDAAATATADDGADGAWDALTQAAVMRTALSAICQDLQTAIGHVQGRLTTTIPGPELDRRATERRGHSGRVVDLRSTVISRSDSGNSRPFDDGDGKGREVDSRSTELIADAPVLAQPPSRRITL